MKKQIHLNDIPVKSRFTLKIILLTVLPATIIVVFSLVVLVNSVQKMNRNISGMTTNALDTIYSKSVIEKNKDMQKKVLLRIEGIQNELNILRADAQGLIDKENRQSPDLSPVYSSWIKQHMVYNPERNWSNLANSELNVSIDVWGYLHNKDGSVNQDTESYISLMSPILPVLQAVGENGAKKGWYYVVGPKQTPIMIMTPWAQMPEIFDRLYPGHNEHNWWDFFFPGLVESWQGWVQNKDSKMSKPGEQVTLTPLYQDAGGTGLMITFFAPLWNKERTQNAGAAAVDYNVSNITGMVYDEQSADEGFTFITLGNGDIIDATDEIVRKLGLSQKANGGTGVEVSYYNLKTSKIGKLAESVQSLTDTNQSVPLQFSDNNRSFIMTYSKLMNYNLWYGEKIVQDKLYIVSILPTDSITNTKNEVHSEIMNLSNRTMLYTIILSILFAIISIVCTVLYAWQQTKQIRLISQGLQQIGDKNYAVSIDVISKDEIGNLAETFNNITRELAKTHIRLENHAMELEEKIKERTVHLQEANQKLELLSQIDPLTKINNRRYFDAELEQTWREYARLEHPISIIMVDIDHFKKYNDYYGHQEGDACLCMVASALAQQLNRSSDRIARYGGEEFVAIVCVGIEEAHNAAEKMRLAVKALSIEHKLSEKGVVTISLGVASVVPSAGKDAMEFIKAADIALYKSKQDGRDVVSVSEWK